MSHGWWTLGRLRGAPIRVHWSVLLMMVVWSRFTFAPVFWLSFGLLILVHELGHAALVLRYRLGLSEIALHGAGGYCRHDSPGSAFQESAIAWGGVLAQLAVCGGIKTAELVLGPPQSTFTATLAYVFTDVSLWLAAFNLIPFEPLDGAKAWRILPLLARRFRSQPARHETQGRPRTVRDELRALEKIDPRAESPNDRTDRIVRDLIARTTQPKDR
jgi:Zn-dependent protease